MKALLLIAHGSRREASNQEIRDLAQRLAQESGSRFDTVIPAFLEIADPDIRGGVDRCVESGATEVVAVPYFLSAGRHVIKDIPAELEKACCDHPDLHLQQSDYLGRNGEIPRILLDLAQSDSSQSALSDEAH